MRNRGTIAIVGAGLIGRVIACDLLRIGHSIVLYDADPTRGAQSCAHMGAGMLAPYCEYASADEIIFRLGWDSVSRWTTFLQGLNQSVFMQSAGTMCVAHALDRPLLDNFVTRVRARIRGEGKIRHEEASAFGSWLDRGELSVLEPSIASRFPTGFFIAPEGQIDNRQLMSALASQIEESSVRWCIDSASVSAHEVRIDGGVVRHELVIDCRGLGAKEDMADLRGVRGELLHVHAPDVELARPIRLMHPRYPLYVVPREGHNFLIGATTIESEDCRRISVQSTLELLSAAFSLHPGFAEAEVVEARIGLRPAFRDNNPRISYRPGLISVNGLYRHGFLMAPKISELVCQLIQTGTLDDEFRDLLLMEETNAIAH